MRPIKKFPGRDIENSTVPIHFNFYNFSVGQDLTILFLDLEKDGWICREGNLIKLVILIKVKEMKLKNQPPSTLSHLSNPRPFCRDLLIVIPLTKTSSQNRKQTTRLRKTLWTRTKMGLKVKTLFAVKEKWHQSKTFLQIRAARMTSAGRRRNWSRRWSISKWDKKKYQPWKLWQSNWR